MSFENDHISLTPIDWPGDPTETVDLWETDNVSISSGSCYQIHSTVFAVNIRGVIGAGDDDGVGIRISYYNDTTEKLKAIIHPKWDAVNGVFYIYLYVKEFKNNLTSYKNVSFVPVSGMNAVFFRVTAFQEGSLKGIQLEVSATNYFRSIDANSVVISGTSSDTLAINKAIYTGFASTTAYSMSVIIERPLLLPKVIGTNEFDYFPAERHPLDRDLLDYEYKEWTYLSPSLDNWATNVDGHGWTIPPSYDGNVGKDVEFLVVNSGNTYDNVDSILDLLDEETEDTIGYRIKQWWLRTKDMASHTMDEIFTGAWLKSIIVGAVNVLDADSGTTSQIGNVLDWAGNKARAQMQTVVGSETIFNASSYVTEFKKSEESSSTPEGKIRWWLRNYSESIGFALLNLYSGRSSMSGLNMMYVVAAGPYWFGRKKNNKALPVMYNSQGNLITWDLAFEIDLGELLYFMSNFTLTVVDVMSSPGGLIFDESVLAEIRTKCEADYYSSWKYYIRSGLNFTWFTNTKYCENETTPPGQYKLMDSIKDGILIGLIIAISAIMIKGGKAIISGIYTMLGKTLVMNRNRGIASDIDLILDNQELAMSVLTELGVDVTQLGNYAEGALKAYKLKHLGR